MLPKLIPKPILRTKSIVLISSGVVEVFELLEHPAKIVITNTNAVRTDIIFLYIALYYLHLMFHAGLRPFQYYQVYSITLSFSRISENFICILSAFVLYYPDI